MTESGLIVAADGLELNPGDTGSIQLLLKPPPSALAGIYSPTIRLYSVNNPDLVLLDVLYLQLLPVYLLNVELLTVVGKVKNQAGVFELRLHNQSNTTREVVLRVKSADEAEVCTYTLTPAQVRLLPGESAIVNLQVQPNKSWWRRPFYGRLLNFFVEIEDTQQLPLTSDRFQGALMWEPRPWWQFLLLVLTVLGIIGVIIFLVWLFFPRAPVPPQIVEFAPGSSSYKEAEDEVVRLNWKISNPKQVQSLKLEGLSPDGVVISEPIVYDLTRGIPNQLKNFCNIQQLLICQNVPTDARKSGDYIFQMTLFTKRGKEVAAQTLKTSTVRIEPIPLPAIVEFASTKPAYEEVSKDVILVGAQGSASIQSSNTPPTTNGQTSSPTNSPQQIDKSDSILLNWKIKNFSQLKALNLIGRAPDGSVNSPLKTYDFSQDIPQSLEKLCEKKEEELTCKNVPTDARKAGTYIFELIPVPKQEQDKPLESKKTDPIKVNPLPVPTRIVEFKINGADALPKYLVEINPAKPIVLVFSWKVEGGKDIKVELLPSPGTVPPVGKIPFPLSQEPGTEIITLQVTNEAKEQISKSVTIETFISPPASPSPSIPMLPPPPGTGSLPSLELPSPPPGGASPSPGGASPSPSGGASPSTPGTPPPLPLPAGNSPPVPPERDSPPPAEFNPKLN